MKIRIDVVLAATLLISSAASAQTLFTYGTHAVNKNEFLQAYNKNPDTTGDKQQKIHDYLDLYINFRLKLQAAYDENVNNNADIKSESENFKKQLAENFINQQADISKLLHEAFVRSQKDILLQQIFVPFSGMDTNDAYQKISKAYTTLKQGKDFNEVAQQYANDSAAKAGKGIIGYITVFTLPYSIESIVYALPQNGFSNIYKSKIGYHIFKNAGERQALGRRKILQLIFPTPSFYTTNQIDEVHKQADSVYNLFQTGTSFESLLPHFGKDYQGYDPASSAIEIKVGQYNSDFENAVFMLNKTGDISKPFKTAYGYNIIKLVELTPVVKDENDVTNTAYLQREIEADGRLNTAKNNLVQKWLPLVHFKKAVLNTADLWVYSDSALANPEKQPPAYENIKSNTELFQFEKKKYTVSDWIDFLKTQPVITESQVSAVKYETLMHDFTNASCNDYYREHIEDFDPKIKDQLKEFDDANMLFYVMDKHVWSKASQDSAGLKNFYNQHAAKYKWNSSLTAVVVSGADKATVTAAAAKIKTDPQNWRNIVTAYGNALYSDSSRFETDQLPSKQPVKAEKNFQTEVTTNDAGDAYSFIHVYEIFPQPETRNFNDAKGLTINDYQDELEKEWVDALKKIYPVKLNHEVLRSIE